MGFFPPDPFFLLYSQEDRRHRVFEAWRRGWEEGREGRKGLKVLGRWVGIGIGIRVGICIDVGVGVKRRVGVRAGIFWVRRIFESRKRGR